MKLNRRDIIKGAAAAIALAVVPLSATSGWDCMYMTFTNDLGERVHALRLDGKWLGWWREQTNETPYQWEMHHDVVCFQGEKVNGKWTPNYIRLKNGQKIRRKERAA